MTLGRTSAGKIKIKTDSPKGLRAVECGCCGGNGSCLGCETLEEITGVSALRIIHQPTGGELVDSYFLIVPPFTNFGDEIIDDEMGGNYLFLSGNSSFCGAGISQRQYSFTRFAFFGIGKQGDQCMATITSGGYGGNGSDFYANWSGSITVPLSALFGSHIIFETGESCQQEFGEWNEELGAPDTITTCTPTQTTSVVIIG